MPTLPADLYHDEIRASIAAIVALLDRPGAELPVPACPGWDLRKLAAHVGRVHRWAAETVASRSMTEIEFRAVPDGRFPDEPTARAAWLTSGAARAIEVIEAAGGAQAWAFGAIRPAGFWSRRLAHETMAHRADAQLAAGEEVTMPAVLAADAIDEWLTVMSGPVDGDADPRAEALPVGRSLSVHAADPDLPADSWLVTHDDDGVRVRTAADNADVSITGPATAVLLVLLGRVPQDGGTIEVDGDSALLAHWLRHTSF